MEEKRVTERGLEGISTAKRKKKGIEGNNEISRRRRSVFRKT